MTIFPQRVPVVAPFGGPRKSTQTRIPTMPQDPKSGAPPSRQSRDYYVQVARQAARRYGVPETLFIAQIQWESGFNPYARGKAGEVGIAQIIPRYHPGADPSNPEAALDYAARLMANHARNYRGRWDHALVAYNAGPSRVGNPPASTRRYVSGVMKMAGFGGHGYMAPQEAPRVGYAPRPQPRRVAQTETPQFAAFLLSLLKQQAGK